MLSASAADLNLLDKVERATRARLKINRSGTWVDVTDLEGRNWLLEVTVRDGVDAPVATMKAVMHKAQFYLNLSPLMDDSKLNASGTLIDLNREVVVEFATFPIDSDPSEADWREVFRGVVHSVDFEKDVVTIDARDQGGALQDLWIEVQRVYGSASGVRVELVMQDIIDDNNAALDVIAANWTWNGTTTVTMSDTSEVVAGDFVGYQNAPLFKVDSVNPNTSITITNPHGLTIPTGSGGGSSIIIPAADRVTMYTENGTATDPLYRNGGSWDDSPDWLVKSFKQSRKRALTAIQDLADQIGWRTRYKWQSNIGAFALMLYEPDRGKTTPDHTFSEDKILNIGKMSLSIADIRNKIRVTYGVADNRTSVYKESSASIAKYGLRAMDIAESSSSQIDSSTEANAMAQAAVDDLSEPTAIASFTLPLFWAIEIGDLYRWEANSRYFDTDQDLAVVDYQHKVSSSSGNQTTINVRGKPSGGIKRWLEYETIPGLNIPVDGLGDSAANNVSAEDSIGAIIVTYDDPRTMDPPITDWAFTRCYVDTSSGFTPGATNLRATGRQTRFEIGGLIPGTTYYVKLQIVDASGNVSTISSQVTAQALKVGPYHTNLAEQRDTLVPNGTFGVFTFDSSTTPPDYWNMGLGTWGPGEDIEVASTSGSTGGSVLLLNDRTGMLYSDRIPLSEGSFIKVGIRGKGTDALSAIEGQFIGYNSAGSQVQSFYFGTAAAGLGADTNWHIFENNYPIVVSSGVVEFSLRLRLHSISSDPTYLDRVWVRLVGGFGWYQLTSSESYTPASSDQVIFFDDDVSVAGFDNTDPYYTCERGGTYEASCRIVWSSASSGSLELRLEVDSGSGYVVLEQRDFSFGTSTIVFALAQLITLEEGDLVRVVVNASQTGTISDYAVGYGYSELKLRSTEGVG